MKPAPKPPTTDTSSTHHTGTSAATSYARTAKRGSPQTAKAIT